MWKQNPNKYGNKIQTNMETKSKQICKQNPNPGRTKQAKQSINVKTKSKQILKQNPSKYGNKIQTDATLTKQSTYVETRTSRDVGMLRHMMIVALDCWICLFCFCTRSIAAFQKALLSLYTYSSAFFLRELRVELWIFWSAEKAERLKKAERRSPFWSSSLWKK